MGGCATKPKVLTGDHERGVPAPVPVKEDAVTSAKVPAEAKVVVVDDKKVVGDGHGGITEITKVEEIVEDGKADDQNTKPRSLSNLFKNDKGQESIPVDDNAPSEALKEESKKAEKAKEESETKQPEVEISKISIESTPTADFVDAPEKKQPEVEHYKTSIERTPTAAFVDAPEKPVFEETFPVAMTETKESSEKKTEDAIITTSEMKTEDADITTSEMKTEDADITTSEMKTEDAVITTSEIKPEDEVKSSEIKREDQKPSDEKKIEEAK
ncbi:uncharacterized protein YFR016C isoform X3 [Mangifera indica]|uniref:uncharacterized protein YFR016C isoform X3 n=1 Tax=Mangifera indica TaxID=29780 RepID=UPI001CFAEF85|nr:uncharacterized protein YFR016C isoform X3 [Mangifera indica]